MNNCLNKNNLFWSLFGASWFFIFNIFSPILENMADFVFVFIVFYFVLEIKK